MKLKLDEKILQQLPLALWHLGSTLTPFSTKNWAAGPTPKFGPQRKLNSDFTRKFEPGSHIGDYIVGWFSSSDANTWRRAFVVATPTKLRVLRPSMVGPLTTCTSEPTRYFPMNLAPSALMPDRNDSEPTKLRRAKLA